MRQGNSFISAFNRTRNSRFTVTTFGARPTAVKPGRNSRPTEARAAIKHGLRSIGLTDRGTGSNTKSTIALTALSPARHSNAPQTAALRGKVPLLFRTRPYTDRLMSIPTATFSLVVGLEAQDFAVCARATHRSQARHPLLTETPLLTLVAACCILARLIPKAWLAKSSSRSIAPAVRLTTTSTCCAVCCRPGDRPPT